MASSTEAGPELVPQNIHSEDVDIVTLLENALARKDGRRGGKKLYKTPNVYVANLRTQSYCGG